jgi:sterol desaturase/sphingolipid hydroxylase (fatty acid hydroxylase superfamily)
MKSLLRQHLFAVTVVATVVAVLIFWHAGMDAELWGAYTYLGGAALLFAAEQWIPRDASWNYAGQGRRFKYKNAAVDLMFLFGVDPWSVALRLAVAAWIVGHVGKIISLPQISSLPIVAQIVLLTLAADGLRYGIHRMQHRISWLWRFHALHHMPVNLVAISASRTHPLDDLVTYVPETILFLLLGFNAGVVSGFYCVVWVIALISHANVDIAADDWISRLLMHPRYHVVHHTLQSGSQPTFNFAEITTLWDRVFGTFNNDPLAKDFKVGVTSEEPRSLGRELLGSLYLPVQRL